MKDCAESFQCRDERAFIGVFIFLSPGMQEGDMEGEVIDGICRYIQISCADFDTALEIRGALHLIGLGFQFIALFQIPDLKGHPPQVF